MLSFSKQIKNEILSVEIPAYCCVAAELSAYIFLLGTKNNNYLEMHIENEELAKRISILATRVFKTNIGYLKLNNDCSIMINMGVKFNEKYGFLFKEPKKDLLTLVYKKNCCQAAFVRGIFLVAGHISNPEKNYDFELSFKTKEKADMVLDLLTKSGFEFKSIKRNNNYILYIKKSDLICDILTFIGANKSPMKILSLKIEREVRNDANRTSNGETANYDKTLKASIKHIQAIQKIAEKKGLESLSDELYETSKLRLEYRDVSLEELSLKHNPPLTKSGTNNRLKKIIKIAEELL